MTLDTSLPLDDVGVLPPILRDCNAGRSRLDLSLPLSFRLDPFDSFRAERLLFLAE